MPEHALQIVKSAHDIGSATAHLLKLRGERPLLLESPAPGATRLLMSFAGAVHDGWAELEGVTAVRYDSPRTALEAAGKKDEIPLLVTALDNPPPFTAEVLIDARMRKKATPAPLKGQAALTVGIGPGFVAGEQVDAVIESNWGERLGTVIWEGGGETYTGKHRVVSGFGSERYLYAPHGGTFRSERALLETVQAGDVVGWVDDSPLIVQAGGLLRGLAHSGLAVDTGAKLVEVDPTGDPANCRGIGTRPLRIAEGVLEAIHQFRKNLAARKGG